MAFDPLPIERENTHIAVQALEMCIKYLGERSMDDNEAKRRERAYRVWEEEGRPEEGGLDHWRRAEERHVETEYDAPRVSEGKGKRTKSASYS
ncbi:hypothetical protein CKA34_27120 (plasmid) [Rhizobium sp. 11515TR]|nr:hypothetical protein CKA34_27120 [Rhizobium sp. 11515TR]